MNTRTLLLCIVTAIPLSGCNRDSDSSTDLTPTAAENQLEINDTNAVEITKLGFTATFKAQSTFLLTGLLTSAYSPSGPIGSHTEDCDSSGSSTQSLSVSDTALPMGSKGDLMTLVFDQCSGKDGIIMSGTLSVETVEISTTQTSMENTLDLKIRGDEQAWLLGDMTTSFSNTGINLSSKQLSRLTNGYIYVVRNMTMDFKEYFDYSTESVSGEIESSKVDGSFIITTEPVFKTLEEDIYPTLGVMTLTGANKSYVQLNADTGDEETALMTVSDGISTNSHAITWESLKPWSL